MGFIITWDETLNQNPLFIGCQPVNNGFELRLFHPKGTWGSENPLFVVGMNSICR